MGGQCMMQWRTLAKAISVLHNLARSKERCALYWYKEAVMAGNQQKPSHAVLPSCRILINDVDSPDFKAAQVTPSRLRIPRHPMTPLQQRPEGYPPYTCPGDDDTRSVPDVDSYHADDETSDSEDVSSSALTDDDRGSSGYSGDSLRTPQFRSSEAFATKLPSIAKRRQLPTPKVRMPTNSIQPSYILQDFVIPYAQSPAGLSSIEAYSPRSSHRSDSDVPLVFSSYSESSSYIRTHDITPLTTGELRSPVADSPCVPQSKGKPLSPNVEPTWPVGKGKSLSRNEQSVEQEQGRSSESKGSVHACNSEHCLKARYISALFEHSARLPSQTPPSFTPSLASSNTGSSSSNKNTPGHVIAPRNSASSSATSRASSTDSTDSAVSSSSSDSRVAGDASSMNSAGNSPASIKSSFTAHPSRDDDSYQQKPPRRAHAPLHLVDPAVTFAVPYSDGVMKTFGIAVSDILEYEGVYMLRANDPMSPLWENVAPGTAINLTIHWKGHAEEKIYPIVVKCYCGFIIRRSQLALALAKAQLSYFATSKLDPAYMPPADGDDPFHPSNFIIKDHHNLHLMSLFTPDERKTWRTNHAIVEDPSTLTVDPEPERTPSGQLLIPNARVLLANSVRRLRAREEMRAQEELRIQELKAQKKREAFEHWKAKQEAKAQKKLAAKKEAEDRKQAKKDAKSNNTKKPESQYDALALGFVSCRMTPGKSCKCKSPVAAKQTAKGERNMIIV